MFDQEKFSNDLFMHRVNKLQITASKACDELNVSHSQIHALEQGKTKNPSIDIAYRCCKWMGKSLYDYLKD